jgi:hypothetical protein
MGRAPNGGKAQEGNGLGGQSPAGVNRGGGGRTLRLQAPGIALSRGEALAVAYFLGGRPRWGLAEKCGRQTWTGHNAFFTSAKLKRTYKQDW